MARRGLVAYVVPDVARYVAGEKPGVTELRSHVRERLPESMVPTAWVLLEALPLTASGKLDRLALPAPEAAGEEEGEAYVAPRTPLESEVAGVWREVLGRDRIGVYESFFDLGGHSLLATQVLSRIRAVFAVDISLPSFFEKPSIANLAQLIESKQGNEQGQPPPPLIPTSREESVLSFAQRACGFWINGNQKVPSTTFLPRCGCKDR